MPRGYLTDLPLICDDKLAEHLRRNNITAIVLSDELLLLWRVKSLVNVKDRPISNLVSLCKQLTSDWRLSVAGIVQENDAGREKTVTATCRQLTKIPRYLVSLKISSSAWDVVNNDESEPSKKYRKTADMRLQPKRGSGQVDHAKPMENRDDVNVDYNNDNDGDEDNTTSSTEIASILVLPQDRVIEFVQRNPSKRILLFDQWSRFLAADVVAELPNCLFAFTSTVYFCPRMYRDCSNESIAGRSTTIERGGTFKAWHRYLANEALLDNDRLQRYPLHIDDPNDTIFWRNLLAILLDDRPQQRRSTATVIVQLLGLRDSVVDHALTGLRVKRFLAFFQRTYDSLVARGCITESKRLELFWTCASTAAITTTTGGCRATNAIEKLIAELSEEASVAEAWWPAMENYTCYVSSDATSARPLRFRVIGCSNADGWAAGVEGPRSSVASRLLRDQSDRLPYFAAAYRGGDNDNVVVVVDDENEETQCKTRDTPDRSTIIVNAHTATATVTAVTPVRNIFLDLTADNVVGVRRDGTLLLSDSSARVFPPVSYGYLLAADRSSIVQRHFTGLPLLKFARPRHN